MLGLKYAASSGGNKSVGLGFLCLLVMPVLLLLVLIDLYAISDDRNVTRLVVNVKEGGSEMGSPSAENHKSSIHLCSIPYSSDRSLRSNGLVLYQANFSSNSSSDRAIPSSDPYNFALTELREYECSIALNVSGACTFCGISVMLKHTKTRCAFFGHAKTLTDGQSEVHIAGKFAGGDYVLTLYVDTVNNADLLGRTVAANGCTELSFDGQVVDYDMF